MFINGATVWHSCSVLTDHTHQHRCTHTHTHTLSNIYIYTHIYCIQLTHTLGRVRHNAPAAPAQSFTRTHSHSHTNDKGNRIPLCYGHISENAGFVKMVLRFIYLRTPINGAGISLIVLISRLRYHCIVVDEFINRK